MSRLIAGAALLLLTAAPTPTEAQTSCEALASLALPDAKILSAQSVAAGAFTPPQGGGRGGRGGAPAVNPYAKLPAFCRVSAMLTPSSDSDIRIEVWLPSTAWNGKFQAVGNGGFAGTIVYPAMAGALAAGYATASTDTGHVGNSADFALGHPEKMVDFSHRAIHEMAVKAKAVIQATYGTAPRRSYFNGCSQGGRQGITSAQRYPADFDGIVAGAPAWGGMRLYAGRMTLNHTVNKSADAVIPAAKYPTIHKAVMNACDARDGVTDGVIENPTACRFDPLVLACKGEDTAACLTPGQIASARAMLSPIKHPVTGQTVFEGHLWPGAELEWDVLGGPQPNNNVVTVFRNLVIQDPKWDPKMFDPATDIDRAMKSPGHEWLLSDNPNLAPFFDRGGKLFMYHGWADPQVPAHTAMTYYNNVLKTVGPQAANSMALFMVPGMLHCNGGPGTDTFDKVAALDAWVERGQKPTRIVASHLTGGKVDKTRPLCPFGQVAKWNGKGDTNDAANFSCVAEPVNVSR
jgi:feruloyl esterase